MRKVFTGCGVIAITCFLMMVVPATAAGDSIVFTSERDGNPEIYTMNPDGSNLFRLTSSDMTDNDPALSPGGTKIAFVTDRDGGYAQIYVMNVDGSNPTRLTDTQYWDGNPAWSPDGSKIAFMSDRDGNCEIYVMNADGSNPARLTDNEWWDSHPAWSPDGSKIAFFSDRDVGYGYYGIFTMNPDGSDQVRLTGQTAADQEPAWSPDGSKIAFVSGRDGNAEIYVMDADGGHQTRLTNNLRWDVEPAWSPDGSKIVFISDRDDAEWHGMTDIYVMNADGSNPTRITDDPGIDEYPDWGAIPDIPGCGPARGNADSVAIEYPVSRGADYIQVRSVVDEIAPYTFYAALQGRGKDYRAYHAGGATFYFGLQSARGADPDPHVHISVWDPVNPHRQTETVEGADYCSWWSDSETGEGAATICTYDVNWKENTEYLLSLDITSDSLNTYYTFYFDNTRIARIKYPYPDQWVIWAGSFIEDFELGAHPFCDAPRRSFKVLPSVRYQGEGTLTLLDYGTVSYNPACGCNNRNGRFENNWFYMETGDDVHQVTGNGATIPSFLRMLITAWSPVDLEITDPDGLRITKSTSEITGALYAEEDLDLDGETDDQVIIPGEKTGEYVIQVIPQPGASPTDTYSLTIRVGASIVQIADHVPISEIPTTHYSIKLERSADGGITITYGNGGIPVPEFFTPTLPLITIIGVLLTVLAIRRRQ